MQADQQQVVDLALRSGAYQSPGEVLDQPFDLLRERFAAKIGWLGSATR